LLGAGEVWAVCSVGRRRGAGSNNGTDDADGQCKVSRRPSRLRRPCRYTGRHRGETPVNTARHLGPRREPPSMSLIRGSTGYFGPPPACPRWGPGGGIGPRARPGASSPGELHGNRLSSTAPPRGRPNLTSLLQGGDEFTDELAAADEEGGIVARAPARRRERAPRGTRRPRAVDGTRRPEGRAVTGNDRDVARRVENLRGVNPRVAGSAHGEPGGHGPGRGGWRGRVAVRRQVKRLDDASTPLPGEGMTSSYSEATRTSRLFPVAGDKTTAGGKHRSDRLAGEAGNLKEWIYDGGVKAVAGGSRVCRLSLRLRRPHPVPRPAAVGDRISAHRIARADQGAAGAVRA
ncbi:hypothetical protein THAOC_24452, partial [Thalassiosira oceanica]